MKIKKILGILIIICVIILCAAFLYSNHHDLNNKTQTNNTTNITKNNTTNITNKIVDNASNIKHTESTIKSNNYKNQKENKEPEYGSDSYVEKWDKSNKNGDDWAYTHSQPVKKENGHDYKRMYDEDSRKSYWYQTDQDYE